MDKSNQVKLGGEHKNDFCTKLTMSHGSMRWLIYDHIMVPPIIPFSECKGLLPTAGPGRVGPRGQTCAMNWLLCTAHATGSRT